eukprot:1160754-Pelagomonas_calceolata.AAC.1
MQASLAAGAVVPYLPDPAMQVHHESDMMPYANMHACVHGRPHTRRMRASLAAGAVVPYLPDPAMQAHLEAQSSPERRAAATAASGQEQPLPYDQGGRPAGEAVHVFVWEVGMRVSRGGSNSRQFQEEQPLPYAISRLPQEEYPLP